MNFDKLVELCKEHGINFSRLEKECGIGNGVIARWKSSSPSVANLKAVADFFGVTVDELLN